MWWCCDLCEPVGGVGSQSDSSFGITLLLLLCRRRTAKIRTLVVSWLLHMFKVCRETMLAMSALMPAASILLFMLAQKTFLHLDSALT